MKWFRIILRTLVVLFLQATIFNRLHITNACHPYMYVLLLICLPVIPRWGELLYGFAVGVLMDIVCSSPGIHTAACVLVAWIRPMFLDHFLQEAERVTDQVVPASVGNSVFMRLSLWITLLHHLTVFTLDTWSWAHWYWVVLQVLVSGIITLGCIYVYGFLFHKS